MSTLSGFGWVGPNTWDWGCSHCLALVGFALISGALVGLALIPGIKDVHIVWKRCLGCEGAQLPVLDPAQDWTEAGWPGGRSMADSSVRFPLPIKWKNDGLLPFLYVDCTLCSVDETNRPEINEKRLEGGTNYHKKLKKTKKLNPAKH